MAIFKNRMSLGSLLERLKERGVDPVGIQYEVASEPGNRREISVYTVSKTTGASLVNARLVGDIRNLDINNTWVKNNRRSITLVKDSRTRIRSSLRPSKPFYFLLE
jgi:hypothetical protein